MQESNIKVDFKNTSTLPVIKKITGLFDRYTPIQYTQGIATDFMNPQVIESQNFQPLCEYKTAKHLSLGNQKVQSSNVHFKENVVLVFNHNLPQKFQFILHTTSINHDVDFDVLVTYGKSKKIIELKDLKEKNIFEFENRQDLPIFTISIIPVNRHLKDYFKKAKSVIPFELDSVEIMKIN